MAPDPGGRDQSQEAAEPAPTVGPGPVICQRPGAPARSTLRTVPDGPAVKAAVTPPFAGILAAWRFTRQPVIEESVVRSLCDVLGSTEDGLTNKKISELLAAARIPDPTPADVARKVRPESCD